MIEFKNVEFSYKDSNKTNIRNLNLSINEGECVVLAGKSGEGKTTIIRLLNGLIPNFFEGKFQGEIKVCGQNHLGIPIHEISEYTGSVFQDPRSQFFCIDVLSELAFTCENFGIPREDIQERINSAVLIMEIEKLLNKKIFDLSSGEKQKIAIASILTQKPKIILLDEPSANLDYYSIKKLERLLKKLKLKGFTLIISEHKLYYLNEIFDKFCYVNSGKIEEIYCKESIKSLTHKDLERKGLRKFDLECSCPKKENNTVKSLAIEIENLNFWFNKTSKIIDNISLKLYKGESIALLGRNGAGKTTFAKLLAGLNKEKSGDIYFANQKLKPKERIKNVSLVLQDADYQLFCESVWAEFLLENSKGNISEEKINHILNLFDLKDLKERHPATLSGGQKQRVTIALTIFKDSSLIIMDEPTSGLDYTNMLKVNEFIKLLKKLNKTILIITHDYEFLMASCDRVLNLTNGKIRDDFDLNQNNFSKIKDIFEEENKE